MTRHALAAGAASGLTRLSGLIREVVFAAFFGAGVETDAFVAAQRVPNLFRDLFAEGSMSNAFVPNFAKTAEKDGIEAAWALANALLGLTLLVLGVLLMMMIIFAKAWVFIVAAGFYSVPAKVELTANLVRILAPFLAAVSMASVFGGMLNVRGKFFLPMVAPAAFNVAIILGCLLAGPIETITTLSPIYT
ncbi:MAG: murein biosynthesis integral membrane protein MurJ, partial [Proteobacteria bacterium]|nr:murein biosynthesis integral membrane protein MurJ [Pseudomonadota bacterium]